MKTSLRATALAAGLVLASASQAASFNFESTTAGLQGPSLVMTDSGLTVTITRIGGADVEIRDLSFDGRTPGAFGARTLSPFNNTGAGAFLLTFSGAISAISVDVGDFAPSDADSFTLTAGTGMDSGSQSGSTGFPTYSTLSVTGVNTFTAVLSGGSAGFPQSVFWDNLNVTAVPEPSTYALMALGLAGVGAVARRRKA